jgi:hypothetical protein
VSDVFAVLASYEMFLTKNMRQRERKGEREGGEREI